MNLGLPPTEIRTLPVETFGLPLLLDPHLLRIARALIADSAAGVSWKRGRPGSM